MSQPIDPPSSSDANSLAAYVDGLLQTAVSSIVTTQEVTPIPLLPKYELSKIDGLYSLPFQQLVGLCDKLGIEHADCRIKYHIVSRIKVVESKLHLLQYALLPPIPELAVIDQYRYQLLSFEGVPYMVSKEKAYNMTLSLLQSQQMQLPHQFGDVVVVDFGMVVSQAGFYSSTCLYPVNYHSQKTYASVFNPDEVITYDCWIKESQGQPLFVISYEGSILFYDWSINSVWSMLQNRIEELRQQRGESKQWNVPIADVGEEYFGLSNRLVQLYLESQPMSLQCSGYIFISQRSFLGRAGDILQREAALSKQQAEYMDLRAHLLRLFTDGSEAAQSMLETTANTCREILRGSRALELLKREEWAERDGRLTQRHIEVCERLAVSRRQKALAAQRAAMNAQRAFQAARKPVPLLPKTYLTRSVVETGGMVAGESNMSPSTEVQAMKPSKQSSKRLSKRSSAVARPAAKREKVSQRRSASATRRQRLEEEEELPCSRRRSTKELFALDAHLHLVREITEHRD